MWLMSVHNFSFHSFIHSLHEYYYTLGNQNSLERVSRIIVYKHYVTDDVINGKVVTGYFWIIERIQYSKCH